MIFYLNRGLILEQEIVRALKDYFRSTGVPEYYKNWTVSVTNEHPFAQLLLDESLPVSSLFPVVVVASESDGKPGELGNLVEAGGFALEPEDIEKLEGRYAMITPDIIAAVREAMDGREDKRIFGVTKTIRRQDHISIEIWAENPQLKNEIYELVRLFVCGFMRDYFEKLYEDHALAIFDNTIRGERSNNYNVDFGTGLSGGHITFDADYAIEQSIIDTELAELNNTIIMEVINHVKGEQGTTRGGTGGGGTGGSGTGGSAGATAAGSG